MFIESLKFNAGSNRQAYAAHALSLWCYVCIVVAKWMPVFACCFACVHGGSAKSPAIVLRRCNWFEVVWINAMLNAAQVIQVKPWSDRSFVEFIHNSMRQFSLRFNADASIPVNPLTTYPFPAPCLWIYADRFLNVGNEWAINSRHVGRSLSIALRPSSRWTFRDDLKPNRWATVGSLA